MVLDDALDILLLAAHISYLSDLRGGTKRAVVVIGVASRRAVICCQSLPCLKVKGMMAVFKPSLFTTLPARA